MLSNESSSSLPTVTTRCAFPRHSGAHTVDCKPLMDAVSDLVAFASSPSFATTPAVIGEQVGVM